MSLITVILIALAILVFVVVGVVIIDKTFTGPMVENAWLAKLILGILALIGLVLLFSGSGVIHLN